MTINGISGMFSRALDGLNVAQRGMSVVSNNIANVNTEDYSRQQFIQGTRALFGDGTLGGGVLGLGITSITDPFIERQLSTENSNWGTYDGRATTLSNVEQVLSDADGSGLGSAISAFFNAWSDLGTNPANGSYRSSVREKARLVCDQFRSMNAQLNQLSSSLSSTISARVTQINDYTSQIADLNRQIAMASDEAAKSELKGQRQLVLNKLSQEIGVNYYEASDGVMTVQIEGSGFSLVSRFDSATLSADDDPSAGGEMAIQATFPGTGGPSVDVTASIESGRLAGNLIDRNETLNDQIDNLDALAYNFTNEVNNLHQTGYGLDGVTNRNFFAPPGAQAGASGSIQIDNSILNSLDAIAASGQDPSGGAVGDGSIATQIVALRSANTMSSGSQTFNQFFTSMGTNVGITAGNVNSSLRAKATLVSKLQEQRESVSGVNLDEEAADLMRYQKAFEASARVLSVASDMMDTLLKL